MRSHKSLTPVTAIKGAALRAAPAVITDNIWYSEAMFPLAISSADSYAMPERDMIMAEEDFPYVMRVRDRAEDDRPREKLLSNGPSGMTMPELVAILLGVGTRKEEVMTMAHRILREYGERTLIAESDPERLAGTLDIPLAKACQLVSAFEIGRRFYEQRAGKPVEVRTARQAFAHFSGMAKVQKEQLRALYLSSRYQVIHEEVVSLGSLTANIVHPREVFRPAIEHGAAAVIVAHNHPSGSLEPTAADIEVTRQLVSGGRLLGIDLLDHLIVVDGDFNSIIGEIHD